MSMTSSRAQKPRTGAPRAFGALAALAVFLIAAGTADAGETRRISRGPDGSPASGSCLEVSVSANGRFVAYESFADNLVPGLEGNRQDQIYVHDRRTGTTRIVSVTPTGEPGNGPSGRPAISANGRYVAFESSANNLVPGLENDDNIQIFVRDLRKGRTRLVSVGRNGEPAEDQCRTPAISGNGRVVAFYSSAQNLVAVEIGRRDQVFVRDRRRRRTQLVSRASDGTVSADGGYDPSLSRSGRFVAFTSFSPGLVPDDTNEAEDVFVHDRRRRRTTRISVTSSGEEVSAPSEFPIISANGRTVVFSSASDDLDEADTNGQDDVYVHDRRRRTTARIGVGQGGAEPVGANSAYPLGLSRSGRHVLILSGATNLVADDQNGVADLFLLDRRSNVIERVSVATDGTESDSHVEFTYSRASLSGNGRVIAWSSRASTLDDIPPPPRRDQIYVHDRSGDRGDTRN